MVWDELSLDGIAERSSEEVASSGAEGKGERNACWGEEISAMGRKARPSVSASCLSFTPLTHEIIPTFKCGKQRRTVHVLYFRPMLAPPYRRVRDRSHACQKVEW